MNYVISTLRIILLFFFVFSFHIVNASELYWVGGQGNWTNPAKWSSTSGGAPGSVIPDENTNAVFDANSGLSAGDNVNIPGGSHDVEDLIVTGFAANFRLRFTGSQSDPTIMNVHGDLRLLTTHSMVYLGSGLHKWIFHGKDSGSQDIKSAGRNLHIVEFPNDNKDYKLSSNLLVTDNIEYAGGNLTTNNFNITTETFHSFNNGSPSESQKNFDLGKSTINCDLFYAAFTYGALNVSGDHTILAKQFKGGATQTNINDTVFYHKVVLKNYEPDQISPLDNNLECTGCVFDSLIIDNVFDTRLKVIFTVEDHFEVVNSSSKILFNGINQLSDEVMTFNGDVVTPTGNGCNDFIVFEASHSDGVFFKRDTGSLVIEDAVLKDVITLGSATFEAANSILLGVSSGWTLVNPPLPKTYYWIGNSGVDDHWDNPDNWEVSPGVSNGCLPSAIDDVVVNNSATQGVRIIEGTLAYCNDFNWTRTVADSLILEGSVWVDTELRIKGDLFFNGSATVSTTSFIDVVLDASSNNNIETNGVKIPELIFFGNNGKWKLFDDLDCDYIVFEAGELITQNFDITTKSFYLDGPFDKLLNLGSSHITVNGHLDLQPYDHNTITINPGTSLIECEGLSYRDIALYDLQLNNSVPLDLEMSYTLDLNTLILNGASDVTAFEDITTNVLTLNEDDTSLLLDPNMTLVVNESIITSSTSSTPPVIKSLFSSNQAKIKKEIGNICVSGNLSFKDINADVSGTFHAPNGVDDGNNSNINFSNSPVLTPLYWIGNSGDWDIKSNWSNVTGGCPVNKDPNTALKLIFDDNSFVSNTDMITLPVLTNCKTMEFNNHTLPANFDIETRLNPLQIFVNDAEVNFNGAKMYVQVQTVVNDGGNLSIDITEGTDPKFDTPTLELNGNANVDVKSNTLLIVRD